MGMVYILSIAFCLGHVISREPAETLCCQRDSVVVLFIV